MRKLAGKRWLAAAGAAALALAGAVRWRTHPSACPYGQRLWVELPHPLITRARLREALAPMPGQRVLEIGPGTGYYTLAVARLLGPEGRLDVFDLQQEMLDHTLRAAARGGVENVHATRGDARSLPYESASFDAAFLVTVLGEIPDQQAALGELVRVIRPGGRLVVGELALGDPHYVRFGALTQRAALAGFRLEQRIGGALGYFAAFSRATA